MCPWDDSGVWYDAVPAAPTDPFTLPNGKEYAVQASSMDRPDVFRAPEVLDLEYYDEAVTRYFAKLQHSPKGCNVRLVRCSRYMANGKIQIVEVKKYGVSS